MNMINLIYAKKAETNKVIEQAVQVTPQDITSPYKRYKLVIDERYLERIIDKIISIENPEFIQYEKADGTGRGTVLPKEEIESRLKENV